METILHIGAHRTASTTFQAFLDLNATRLQAHGIGVWTPERTRAGLFSGLVRRPETITLQIERRAARSSGLIRLEQERLASTGLSHLIVSEENMIGAVRNNLRERSLYPHLDERLMRFRDGFAARCSRIAIAIRAYEGYWSSALAQALAQGDRMPDAGLLDRLVSQPRRWRDVVREVARTFPDAEVVVWPFERLADRPEAQLRLMTGIDVLPEALDGLRAWRNRSPRLPDLRRALDRRDQAPAAMPLPEGDGRWMPFDADHRLEMNAAYQMDLNWLRAGACGLARLVEDPAGGNGNRTEEATGIREPAAERAEVPPNGGHADEGPRRALV